MEDEKIDITKIAEPKIISYMSKEEFITMLSNFHFTHIKDYEINLITGFEYDAKEDELHTRGYFIRYY